MFFKSHVISLRFLQHFYILKRVNFYFSQLLNDELYKAYINFLSDKDGQVIEAAVKKMDSLIDFIPAEKFKEEVVTKLELLYKDESMRVRKALAEHDLQI